MIGTPQVVQMASQHTASIRLTIPRAEIQQVMGPAIGEVMATVAAQGMTPAGPVFSHHLKMDYAQLHIVLRRSGSPAQSADFYLAFLHMVTPT